jgi:SnoaL-like polyketide cyclase
MSKENDNKAIVGRWFTDFWGKTCKLDIVDELAAPDMLLQYSLHEPRRGHDDIKAFMRDFRAAFPDLNFWGTASVAGKVAVRILARSSGTSLSGRFRRRRVARCASAARLCCVFRTAESSKRSVSTTALPLSCSSVC